MTGRELNLAVTIILTMYVMEFGQASDLPTPYYGSTEDPVVVNLSKHCSIPADSVPAISPSQYKSLISNVKSIYNISYQLHDQSRKYYNNIVSVITMQGRKIIMCTNR